MYHFDGSTVLVIKTDMTYTVTHQTTHILSAGGPQNALDKSHTKPPARQAARRTGVLDRCRRAKDKPGGQPRRVAPLDGGQPGRLLWRTGPPPSTVAHPTASMGITNGAALAAASTHDTQTHHLPPTLYEEPFHPCNICTGVPPTLKRPAPTRVVLWDPQTTNTSTRGCSMCPGGASP